MKTIATLAGVWLMAAVPFAAGADDMSYGYFQLEYLEADVDGTSPTAEGFGVKGSFGFAQNFFVFTDISKMDVSNVDIDQYAIGLGGHYALSDNVDLVGRAGWAKFRYYDNDGPFISDTGYVAGAGIRARGGDHFEFELGVVHVDFGYGADDTGGEAAARYHFNKNWALALEYQELGDLSTFMGAFRLNFGK